MPFKIIRNDITKVRADAIVNTANPEPVCGSGTDTAVYEAAGKEALLTERRKIGRIKSGEAAVTKAFALPAKFIIHTVGPVWEDGNHGEYETLASCYRKSLLLARELGCRSIAFPLISTGNYGFPKDRALAIALETISAFLDENEMDVTLVVFDRRSFALSASLVSEVGQFIDENYVSRRQEEEYFRDREESGVYGWERENVRRRRLEAQHMPMPLMDAAPSASAPKAPAKRPGLSDVMRHMGESFQERLLRLIDERGYSDTEVYKRANIDRKLFSKIRCNADYTPKKRTAVALALALELNLDETLDLLGRAGLTLSPSSKFDLIVKYCIENSIYDIFEINALLFTYDQPLLGV